MPTQFAQKRKGESRTALAGETTAAPKQKSPSIRKLIKKIQIGEKDYYQFNVFVVRHDGVKDFMLVSPGPWWDNFAVIFTARDLSEDEVDHILRMYLETDIKCACGRSGGYMRVELDNNGKPKHAVCGDCDPTIKYAILYFKNIDILFDMR